MFKIDLNTLSQPFPLALDIDGQTEEFSVFMETCPDPCCSCTTAGLILTPPKVAADDPLQSPAWARIKIDVIGRQVLDRGFSAEFLDGGHTARKALEMVEAELNSREWNYLTALFYVIKDDIVNETPISELKKYVAGVEFDREHLVAYHELFPFSFSMPIPEGPNKYLPIESYCVDPECSCTEVMVQFDGIGPNNDKLQFEPLQILFDYQRKAFKKEESKPKRHAMALRLGKRLLKSHPEWTETLERRHLKMKEICN